MSGDVQPRKRKDKKKKKDELSAAEELRGTAASFGEGDVLMHSQHDHGTGGHWCAKIIFFSLLAVLVTLIGLIILENRGLSDLEANAVESRYAGVLDGWLEDAPDDHHDPHTLELKHPEEEDHEEVEASDEEDHDTELEDIEHEPEELSTERFSSPLSAEANHDDDEAGDDDDDEAGGEDDDDEHEEGQDDDEEAEQSAEDSPDAASDDDNASDDDDFLQQDDDDDDDFLQHDAYDDNDDGGDQNDGDDGDDTDENVSAPVSAEAPYEEVEDSSEQLPADSLLEEEQYEQEQELQRQQAEAESHVWLKVCVGAALLVATHAVVRRARFRSPESEEGEEPAEETEETPQVVDRRMTLLPDEPPATEVKKSVAFQAPKPKRVIREPTPPPEEPDEPEEPEPEPEPEREEEPEEEEVEEEIIFKKPAVPPQTTAKRQMQSEVEPEDEPTPSDPADDEREESEGEVPDDVEIIDDEALEEEVDEEEISDVDDAELLSRLEAKYGRLPEPERYGHKEGENKMMNEDEWPDEPSDEHWRRELDLAEEEMNRGSTKSALARTGAPQLSASLRARWIAARALDALAEERKDNALLVRAIDTYLELLKIAHKLSNAMLSSVAERAIDRIRFKGIPLEAAPAHRALAQRFPEEVRYRNQLVVSYLMANRVDLAKQELKSILEHWPDDRVALVHYGFVLKMEGTRLDEAVDYLQKALDGDAGEANEGRFHYHLGDALLLLGRREEALEVHERAAKLGHFKSAAQRSLYNVDRLKAQPWWEATDTPYGGLVSALEASWRDILKEGEAARALYEAEKEGLRERGEWSQLDVYSRGREISGRCARAPTVCRIVRAEPAAVGCRRGQIKFSLLQPGSHIRPHVGPTNCRIRMHLALSNTSGAYLRVHNETRQWAVGKVLAFDDSFEHEVWHNGTAPRLVLIVDVWHPQLTAAERRTLPAI